MVSQANQTLKNNYLSLSEILTKEQNDPKTGREMYMFPINYSFDMINPLNCHNCHKDNIQQS